MIALFFDTETTGIRTADDPGFVPKLVQLGAIMQDIESGMVLHEIKLLTKDCGPIPEGAARVHGITDDIAGQHGLALVGIDRLFAALIQKSDMVVGHNLEYDLDVVFDNMPDSWEQMKLPKPRFCTKLGNIYTVKAPQTDKQKEYWTRSGKLPDHPYKWPTLAETYRYYFKRDFDGAHDAMADIRATRDIFMCMLDQKHITIKDNKLVPAKRLKLAKT